ncbi:transporter, partial [Salmonella enterica subsp. enterica serovar Panama]|nr:transporter [Salmonella enterica subsp. enterica serovar Panama]
MSLSLSSVRRRLYHNLFELTARSGGRFEGLCALLALLNV